MKYELIIIRYGEIGLKAKNTRKRFEDTLLNNIKKALKSKQILFRIKKEWGRIYLFTDQIKECIVVLKKIFGISSISPAIKTKTYMKSISKLAINITKEYITTKKSFALRVERTGKHSFSSQDVAIQIGNDVVKKLKLKVNLTKPDFELFIEIRDENTYLFTKKIHCLGGLPLRTQGNILAYIDSLESILAAWYLMRRGSKTIFLNSNKSISNVLSNFIDQWYTDHDVVMIDNKKKRYEYINDLAARKKCVALVTGHSLYNSSKEVLEYINILNDQIEIPVLHPLIAMKKNEIIKKCKEIGLRK